jgi:riboflavin kinase/FMN adenylyltransferase
VHGAQRGEALGWPTANLRLPEQRVIPADGVYATRVEHRGTSYQSVSYIGTRPTFGRGERLLEVYILDERVTLYGEPLRVCFIERLRGDMTFATAGELSARIQLDVEQARASFKSALPAGSER